MNNLLGQLMGYLIAFLVIIWFIFYVVIPFFIISILVIIGVVGSAASLHGFWNGIISFIDTAKDAWQDAENHPLSNPIAKKINTLYGSEPAFLLPIYDQYWSFMTNIYRDIWSKVHKKAKWWFDQRKAWWEDGGYKDWFMKIVLWSAAVGAYIGGIFHYIATFLIVAIAIVVLLAVIVVGIFLMSTVMVLFEISNKLYGWYYQISYVCPTCHKPMEIPIHICGNCTAEHKKLWPSVYGIRSHRCNGEISRVRTCNEELATIGKARRDLSKKCPHCNSPVEGLGGTNIHLPIVGGRGVGKSHFITMSVMKLMDYAPSQKLEITFPDVIQKRNFDGNKNNLETGTRLKPTQTDSGSGYGISAFNLQVKKTNRKIPKLLYIYDSAGEIYQSDNSMEEQKYFDYIHGIFFIIDPFAIEQIRNKYSTQLRDNPGIVNPSIVDIMEVLSTMITTFEKRLNVNSNQKFYQPIAIVINKCDAFDLDEQIGQKAVIECMRQYPEIKTEAEAINKVVKTFLENYAHNFLQSLDQRFVNIRYFSCSSIGHSNNDNDANKFEGERVLEPMLWLLSQTKVLSGQPPLISRVISRR